MELGLVLGALVLGPQGPPQGLAGVSGVGVGVGKGASRRVLCEYVWTSVRMPIAVEVCLCLERGDAVRDHPNSQGLSTLVVLARSVPLWSHCSRQGPLVTDWALSQASALYTQEAGLGQSEPRHGPFSIWCNSPI